MGWRGSHFNQTNGTLTQMKRISNHDVRKKKFSHEMYPYAYKSKKKREKCCKYHRNTT